MARYRDEISRITLRQLRAQFPPRVFVQLRRLTLHAGVVSCEAEVIVEAGSGCFGGQRRWLLCPRCGKKTVVIGFAYDGPGCRSCIRWRGGNRRRLAVAARAIPAPHVKNVIASSPGNEDPWRRYE